MPSHARPGARLGRTARPSARRRRISLAPTGRCSSSATGFGEDDAVAQAVRVRADGRARVLAPGIASQLPHRPSAFNGHFVPRIRLLARAVQAGRCRLGPSGTHVFSDLFYQPGALLPASATLIHLDSDADALGRSEPTHLAILASPKMGLAELVRGPGRLHGPDRAPSCRDQMQCYRGGDRRESEQFRQQVAGERGRSRWVSPR